MPSEAQMWERLREPMLKLRLDPVRVENPALPGTPDVNYREGWVELKHADRWPPKGGPLRLTHPPTPEQLVFLTRRWEAGGAAFLCLRVGREWLLFRGRDANRLWNAGREAPPGRGELVEAAELMSSSPREVAERLGRGR